ncbi:MAG: ChaN family lipoprotein [Phycisphaerales bacterium]|jgi:uncharacterized iron-regulated protein|nr:ChaN family lipoprotein [Phycisphaerales bacterium]
MHSHVIPAALAGFVTLLVGGCASAPTPVTASTVPVRTDLVVLDGHTGDHLTWDALVERLGGADVVVLGEQHNDATGHAVQLAVVEDLLTEGGSGAVALEMLERDEQVLIEDYREGLIDAEVFARLSRSTSWAGPGSWEAWYQPIIDAAIDRDAGVVAANAPRRYVKVARTEGWERLDQLADDRKWLVDHPDAPITGAYRDRFIELMGGHSEDDETDEEALELAESFFLAQQVWDATMANSVSQALEQSGPPVILLVGRFHSDAEGGTTRQIARLHPSARIVTISLEPACEDVDFEADIPQADFIVCTEPE